MAKTIRKRPVFVFSEEDLTEQEHLKDCDINHIVRKIQQGQQVLAGATPQYGHDDLTMSGLDYRIQREQTEQELREIAETHEFTEEEIKLFDPEVSKKFNFKTKKGSKGKTKNDDQTTNNVDPKEPDTPPKNPASSGSPDPSNQNPS